MEKRNFLHILGERLMQERARLGLTQAELAHFTGVARRTQINYESGSRAPDAVYLDRVDQHGIDAHFVLTGRRQSGAYAQAGHESAGHHAAQPGLEYTITGLRPGNVRASVMVTLSHVSQHVATGVLDVAGITETIMTLAEMSNSPEQVRHNAAHLLKHLKLQKSAA